MCVCVCVCVHVCMYDCNRCVILSVCAHAPLFACLCVICDFVDVGMVVLWTVVVAVAMAGCGCSRLLSVFGTAWCVCPLRDGENSNVRLEEIYIETTPTNTAVCSVVTAKSVSFFRSSYPSSPFTCISSKTSPDFSCVGCG